MIGSVRASLPRVIPRNATVSARCIVTKSERWTPATVRGANLLEGEAEELSKVLPNIESHWSKLSKEAQYSVYKQLEELQRKDWKDLSINEQKGAYFVSYGPHGPRKMVTPDGQNGRVFVGTALAVGLGLSLFFGIRSMAAPPPKTMTTEYQEQMTARAKQTNQNPISGIASENYKGKGHVI